MGKVIKIVIGTILLGASLFYFVGICLVIADAKEDAVYSLRHYIQIEQTGCEYIGKNPVIDGQEKEAREGYGFYTVTFEARNLSSASYYGGFSYILDIDTGQGDRNVGEVVSPPYYTNGGYFSTADPALPGKTSAELVYYLEVKGGVDTVHASYRPTWDEKQVELDILLK